MNTSFQTIFDTYNWEETLNSINAKTVQDVEFALAKTKRDLEDFKALISPAARPYLEQMAQQSRLITKKRFGNTIQMYVPMYLSNECQNICTYCGFSMTNKIPRRTLTDADILKEVIVYSGKTRKKGNPAIAILRKIWAKKHRNGVNMYDQYEYDKYEKIEFDLNKQFDKLVLLHLLPY